MLAVRALRFSSFVPLHLHPLSPLESLIVFICVESYLCLGEIKILPMSCGYISWPHGNCKHITRLEVAEKRAKQGVNLDNSTSHFHFTLCDVHKVLPNVNLYISSAIKKRAQAEAKPHVSQSKPINHSAKSLSSLAIFRSCI